MDRTLQLIAPTTTLEAEFRAFCGEFGGPAEHIDGSGSLASAEDFAAAVQRALNHARGVDLPEGWVPAHTFWLARDGRTILGTINLRHALTPSLERQGGHIGYAIRPSERGRGYATRMLGMVLPVARQVGLSRVLITCDKRNLASARVIQKNGGVLQDEIPSGEPGRELTQRWWIEL